MKNILCLLFTLPCLLFSEPAVILDNPALLSFTDHLPHEGLLKQTPEGFLYIELPKEYVFSLLPLIPNPPSPPPYFSDGKIGAHITVASAQEIEKLGRPSIPHLGESIPFTILSFAYVRLEKCSMGSEIYLLEVEAPMIEEIRTSLGLPLTMIPDGKYHITIGVK